MKIININKTITSQELLDYLTQKVNPLFHQHRQSDLNFKIENIDGAIEISQPEKYEGVLFRIVIRGKELLITRSEHYVDDVNSLTVESILNSLFEDLAGNSGVKITLEG
ncbi:MAG: hypothetical protein JWR67_1553 [Mucilaginibacter sp.]|nr:hypothetical protein [Mucilaginibacter sp.]